MIQTVSRAKPSYTAGAATAGAATRFEVSQTSAGRPFRQYPSPSQVLRALQDGAREHGGLITVDTRAWNGVTLARVAFAGAGSVRIPPLGCYGLLAVEDGGASMLVPQQGREDVVVGLASGATIVHGPGQGCRYSWTSAHAVTWISVDTAIMKDAAVQSGLPLSMSSVCRSAILRHDVVAEHARRVLAREAARRAHPTQALVVESAASLLACRVLERLRGGRGLAHTQPDGLHGRVFERVRAFIEHNMSESLTLNDLAQVAGVSRFHFARQFRLKTGESPMGYLLRVRVERAKRLLRAGETRVSDIAAGLGFADQSHFSRTFRRLVGVAPSKFMDTGRDVN